MPQPVGIISISHFKNARLYAWSTSPYIMFCNILALKRKQHLTGYCFLTEMNALELRNTL